MKKITIELPDDESAETFASWLSGQGEQDFFIWAEINQEDVQFSIDYHNTKIVNGKKKYGNFMEDDTIRITYL